MGGPKRENRDNKSFWETDFFWNNQLSVGIAAAMGKITDVNTGDKFGEFDGRGPNDGSITVWEQNVQYPYQFAQYQPSVASTSADDTLLGVGARTIQIQGNAPDGTFQSEDLELNGQTPVSSTLLWSRNYRMKVLTAGSNKMAVGTIYTGIGSFTNGVPNTILAQVTNGNGQSLMCTFTVPKGFTCLITSISYSTRETPEVIFKNMARENETVFDNESVFQLKRIVQIGNRGNYTRQLDPPTPFPEFTDIEIRGETDSNNDSAESSFKFYLIPNDWYERR